jgi:hypothetical protein
VNKGAFNKEWPRGTYDDMHFMPKFHQLIGQIGQVNSLTPAVRISAIAQ